MYALVLVRIDLRHYALQMTTLCMTGQQGASPRQVVMRYTFVI